MIDIHNHILPGLDEGSIHIEITKFYLEKIEQAKMHSIVFTPRYFKGFVDNTKDVILDVFNKVEMIKKELGYTFNSYLGAEVYLIGRDVIDDIQNNMFLINGTRYILIANSMTGFTPDFFSNIHKLVKEGYKPILAHAERYKEIKENPLLAAEFMHRDVYIQISTKSILGKNGDKSRDVALELIEKGYAHFLGTNCLCQSGTYDYPEAVETIISKFDETIAHKLSFEYPNLMIHNEDIPYFYKHQDAPQKKMGLFKRLFNW